MSFTNTADAPWRLQNAPSFPKWDGVSANYIASRIGIRVYWELMAKNLCIEGGEGHLFAGDLIDNADKHDTTYFYSQAVFWF